MVTGIMETPGGKEVHGYNLGTQIHACTYRTHTHAQVYRCLEIYTPSDTCTSDDV